MKPVTERPRSLLLIPILIVLLLTGNGCSTLIASRGVSNLDAIATTGSTRQEVRRVLGDPESSKTRDDGMIVETYRVRRKVVSAWGPFSAPSREEVRGFLQAREAGLVVLLLAIPVGLGFEVYATGKAIADSEKKKYQVALVYGPDDRLLYLYDVNAPPDERFDAARRPLAELQWKQLENDECPTWSACLTSYVDELRKRAAFVGYTLPPDFQRVLDVARERDEGRATKGQALIGIAGLDVEYPVPSRTELDRALYRQLEVDGCPSWVVCVAFYVDEVRRRVAFVEEPLPKNATRPWDEERLLEIARGKDEGRITKEHALGQIRTERLLNT